MNPRVEHVLGFASSRAGIGKTTLVVNLAVWLAARGHALALLDADLGAPDALGVLGARGDQVERNGIWQPLDAHGVRAFSLGAWIEQQGLAGVRGELLLRRLAPLLDGGIDFGAVEFLLVDLAPGAEAQELWLDALGLDALVRVELEDDESALEPSVPVLGRIECMVRAPLEDERVRRAAALGRVPFDPELRALAGRGTPLVLAAPRSAAAQAIARIGANLVKRVRSRLSD